jgi:hypothetical protein
VAFFSNDCQYINSSAVNDVGIATGYGMDGLASVAFMARFFFSTKSRLVLGFTHPLIQVQWVPRAISLGVKWPGREADHSPLSSAEVKNGGAIPPLPHMFS